MVSALGDSGFLITQKKQLISRQFPSEEISYKAILISEPVIRGKVIQCDLITVGQHPIRLRASILRDTIEHRYLQLHAGDGIQALSYIKSVNEMTQRPTWSQSHFNLQRWLQVQGITGQTFIYSANWQQHPACRMSLPMMERTRLRLLKLRQKAIENLRESGLDGQEHAIVAAMVLGDRSAITKEMRETYSVSGASHVLALSGLHLGIIYWLLSLLFVHMRWQRLGQLVTLPAIWIFSLMVGFSPSIVRAATMLTICSFVMLLRRQPLSLNSLSLAALVMLVANPLSLWDVGFQLSFMAVLAIVCFYRPIERTIKYSFAICPDGILQNRIIRTILLWMTGIIAVSLATQLLVAPLVAYYFGRFPTYFLLTNLVAIPLVTFILYFAVLYFLILAFTSITGLSIPILQSFVNQTLNLCSFTLNNTLGHIASFPGSSIEGLQLNEWQLVLVYILIGGIIYIIAILRRNLHDNKLYQQR